MRGGHNLHRCEVGSGSHIFFRKIGSSGRPIRLVSACAACHRSRTTDALDPVVRSRCREDDRHESGRTGCDVMAAITHNPAARAGRSARVTSLPAGKATSPRLGDPCYRWLRARRTTCSSVPKGRCSGGARHQVVAIRPPPGPRPRDAGRPRCGADPARSAARLSRAAGSLHACGWRRDRPDAHRGSATPRRHDGASCARGSATVVPGLSLRGSGRGDQRCLGQRSRCRWSGRSTRSKACASPTDRWGNARQLPLGGLAAAAARRPGCSSPTRVAQAAGSFPAGVSLSITFGNTVDSFCVSSAGDMPTAAASRPIVSAPNA